MPPWLPPRPARHQSDYSYSRETIQQSHRRPLYLQRRETRCHRRPSCPCLLGSANRLTMPRNALNILITPPPCSRGRAPKGRPSRKNPYARWSMPPHPAAHRYSPTTPRVERCEDRARNTLRGQQHTAEGVTARQTRLLPSRRERLANRRSRSRIGRDSTARAEPAQTPASPWRRRRGRRVARECSSSSNPGTLAERTHALASGRKRVSAWLGRVAAPRSLMRQICSGAGAHVFSLGSVDACTGPTIRRLKRESCPPGGSGGRRGSAGW